ncbi:MAG: hypothetical protein AAFU49_06225 [Pseudomonadota bacterium]
MVVFGDRPQDTVDAVDGMDAVESVMAGQDPFGLTISDAKAERMRISGDLCDLTRCSMGANAASLARAMGPGNRQDIWSAVVGLTRDHTSFERPIDRDTTNHAKAG